MYHRTTRRDFLRKGLGLGLLAWSAGRAPSAAEVPSNEGALTPKLGLVTYLWGKDWTLPTLIGNCEKANILGVELRTTHAHGVEPSLSDGQRAEVKNRFGDSPVVHVGIGSNENFDSPDPQRLRQSIEATKAFVKLSHDTGGSGVKVKPNSFHKNVDRKKTIAQISDSLNQVGQFAGDYGQEIRLEVHGSCGAIPTIKEIMDGVTDPNVGICWNCNGDELEGKGLSYHFHMIRERFGATCHVRELDSKNYPYENLIRLLVETGYDGWVLLECRTSPADRVQALLHQRALYEEMLGQALQ